jgi:hypothetical protein
LDLSIGSKSCFSEGETHYDRVERILWFVCLSHSKSQTGMRVCNRWRSVSQSQTSLLSLFSNLHISSQSISVSTSSSFYGVFTDRRVFFPLCDRWFYSSPSTFWMLTSDVTVLPPMFPHHFTLCARFFTHFLQTFFLHHMITKQGVRAFVLIFLFLPHTEEIKVSGVLSRSQTCERGE